MAIQYLDTFTIPRSQISGAGLTLNIMAAFLDESGNLLHVVATDTATDPTTWYWKVIDISNRLATSSSDWTPSSIVYPDHAGDSDALGDQNLACFDAANNITYMVEVTPAGHSHLIRINMATGLVEYSSNALKVAGNDSVQPPIRGLQKIGNTLYMLFRDTDYYLGSWNISSLTWQTSTTLNPTPSINETTLKKLLINEQAGAVPVGLYTASDGNLVVLYDDRNWAEKYDPSLNYLGATAWSASDIGAIFSQGGFIWSLSDTGSGEELTVNRYLDQSTNVISREKSRYRQDDRVVWVGEDAVLPLVFEARDGFGSPMTSLSGRTCTFEILTSRGALNADDAALSLTQTPESFRTEDDKPVTRKVNPAFNAQGEATAYFQSARTSLEDVVVDQVKITFP